MIHIQGPLVLSRSALKTSPHISPGCLCSSSHGVNGPCSYSTLCLSPREVKKAPNPANYFRGQRRTTSGLLNRSADSSDGWGMQKVNAQQRTGSDGGIEDDMDAAQTLIAASYPPNTGTLHRLRHARPDAHPDRLLASACPRGSILKGESLMKNLTAHTCGYRLTLVTASEYKNPFQREALCKLGHDPRMTGHVSPELRYGA